jgi:hypothetical protein
MAVPPSGNMKAADVTTDIATPISGDLAKRSKHILLPRFKFSKGQGQAATDSRTGS